jgi:hypothetical protein
MVPNAMISVISCLRRLRFSLRAFLIAMAAIAVFLAVWAENARKQRFAVDWVLRQGGHVTYDFEWPNTSAAGPLRPQPPGPKWLHDWLGIEYLATVTAVILDRDEIDNLKPLSNLPRLQCVGLMNYVHPGTDFSPLGRLKYLDELHLNYTGIDTETAGRIKAILPSCRILSSTNPELRNDL